FNPIVTSLRDLEQLSSLKKVKKKLNIPRFGKSTIADALRVFDPALLAEVITELAKRVPVSADSRLRELDQVLTAVDGSLLKALPRMSWALWLNDSNRAVKIHIQFDVLKGVPESGTVTDGNGNEKAVLEQTLQSGRFYALDAGYAKFTLFQKIIDTGSSFVGRIRDTSSYEVLETRPLTAADHQASVSSDRIVRLGSISNQDHLKQPLRLLEVKITTRDGGSTIMLLATNRMDLPAEVIALCYRYRWQVELFFRWLKCTLNFKHLLSDTQNGIEIQVYAALIATLLVAILAGKKPNKRTWVMIGFYLQGLADEEELLAHLKKLPQA
ncbi:IS4 family transposase, partial [Planctomycetota bacterium]